MPGNIVVVCLGEPTHVLARADDSRWRLPVVSAELDPDDENPLPEVRSAILRNLTLDGPLLELHLAGKAEPISALLVLECPPGTWAPPDGFAWQPAGSIEIEDVQAPIRPRVRRWLEEAGGLSRVPSLRAAWSRSGWLQRATGWIDERLASAGRGRIGPVEQMRLWGISTLLRAHTREGSVWLKAAYPPFATEPRTIRLIAERFPDRIPTIVATNDAEGWTLLDDFGTSFVGEDRTGAIGVAAIGSLAGMQQGFAAAIDALRNAGAVSRPLDRLTDQVADAFGHPIGPKPWSQDPDQRRAIVDQLRGAVDRVEGLGIADSLVHGDFHPWNVADVGGKPVIFDWTDTAVGNPLVDFATWVGWVKDPQERRELFEPWIAAWSPVVPATALRERYDDVLAVGAAYQVVSYVGIVRTLESELGSQVSGGAVSFANLLEEALSTGS